MEEIQKRQDELKKKASDEKAEQAKKEKEQQDEQDKRNKEAAKEMERIQGLEKKAAEEEVETRDDLLRKYEEIRVALSAANLEQDKQNELLREAERVTNKRIAMDKKAAEDKQKADDEAVQRKIEAAKADQDAKGKWADTKEGQQAAAVAESPEMVARRIAQTSGRKLGTVKQMINRGDVDPASLDRAARANLDEMWQRKKEQNQTGDKSVDVVTGQRKTLDAVNDQGNTMGALMNRQDAFEAEQDRLRQYTKMMQEAAERKAADTRRKYNSA